MTSEMKTNTSTKVLHSACCESTFEVPADYKGNLDLYLCVACIDDVNISTQEARAAALWEGLAACNARGGTT